MPTKALMDTGIAFARQYQLTPGVALTPAQMAQLSADIVWLVPQSVTLADGSTQQVLVPQVYIRRPQDGDLRDNGALMAGSDVLIKTTGDIVSNGRITGDRSTTLVGGRDVDLSAGSIRGQQIFVKAVNDLKTIGTSVSGAGPDSTATLLAGRDIIVRTTPQGTRSVTSEPVQTGTRARATFGGGSYVDNASVHQAGTETTSGGNACRRSHLRGRQRHHQYQLSPAQ